MKQNLNRKLLLTLLFLVATMPFLLAQRMDTSDIQAHRGGSGLYPENTLIAMLNAAAMGVNVLELDVHMTQDNKVVLSHDAYFSNKKALGPGGVRIERGGKMRHLIYSMPYSTVKKYDVGLIPSKDFPNRKNIGASVPLLSEVITRVDQYTQKYDLPAVTYNIEIKSHPLKDERMTPRFDRYIEHVMAVIRGLDVEKRVIIQSFDVRTLEYMHKFYPAIKLSYLVEKRGNLEKDLSKISFIPAIYSPHYKKVDERLMERAHLLNMEVIPWTVNKRSSFLKLLKVGVDGIITDYPNRAMRWLEAE